MVPKTKREGNRMNIGIVGSRRREDKEAVHKLVDSLKPTDVVISGGCRGVDSWATERAQQRGMSVKVFKPDMSNLKDHWELTKRYYARNKLIAENSDILYAFVSPDRKGGTEVTIKYAQELRKEIRLM